MNEIEKMYKNAGIKMQHLLDVNTNQFVDVYPPFTAEKQLEIVKQILFSTWWMNLKRLQFSNKFDEGLAQIINDLWQDLTEEEKQQVKGILE